jgi:prevent-host-death family protein
MQMNIADAKAKLSELISLSEQGQEVVIARGGQPVVRLVPIVATGFRFGLAQGEGGALPDFLAPLSEEELADWE